MMLHYPAGVFIASLAACAIVVPPPRSVIAFSPGGGSPSSPTSLSTATITRTTSTAARRQKTPVHRRRRQVGSFPASAASSSLSSSSSHGDVPESDNDGYDDNGGAIPPPNPYADPNYPDLEFVNYDDPAYSADRSEYSDGTIDDDVDDVDGYGGVDSTMAEIEAMREERRRKNDEYQFETYHASVLRGGERILGEWTVFQTDTFMGKGARDGRDPMTSGVPRLLKWDKVLKVVSRGCKTIIDPRAEWRVDGERIVHEERLATMDDFPTLMMFDDEDDYDIDIDEEAANEDGSTTTTSKSSDAGSSTTSTHPLPLRWETEDVAHVEDVRCHPAALSSIDFRGPGGNMCVGKAYTICDATPYRRHDDADGTSNDDGGDGSEKDEDEDDDDDDVRLARRRVGSRGDHDGPFRELRTELGVQENGMRFRVKLDYALLEEDDIDDAFGGRDAVVGIPPLHLRTLTVCRETLDGYWPKQSDNESSPPPPSSSSSSSSLGGGGGGVDSTGGRGGGGAASEGMSTGVRRSDRQEEIARALFGPPGAPGGLYDPPPVGSEERAVSNYMLLDFEGGATLLLPHRLDQHPEGEDEYAEARGSPPSSSSSSSSQLGWVTSLDWTPGKIRYQVDRKVLGGTKLKGLRTLELSEVQGEDADRWRPRDGGSDMRQ
jgi:hypothetical protein